MNLDLNYDAGQFWLSLLNTIGLVCVAAFTWWTNRDKATATAIEAAKMDSHSAMIELAGRMTQFDARLVSVEHEVRERLRSEDLHDLYERIGTVNREMGEFCAALKSANEQLRIHQEYLLSRGNH